MEQNKRMEEWKKSKNHNSVLRVLLKLVLLQLAQILRISSIQKAVIHSQELPETEINDPC